MTPEVSSASGSSPRLLHLGCGLLAPPEWVNVDGSFNAWLAQHPVMRRAAGTLRLVPRRALEVPWPRNIRIANLRRRLPFADASFDAVYSSHTIEHLTRGEGLSVLKEAWRVLRPGGVCRTLVPDLESLIREYLGQGTADGYDVSFPDDPGRQFVTKLNMRPESAREGLLHRAYSAASDYHSHKWFYDARAMTLLMQEAGFTNCRRRGFLETEIPHLDKVEQQGRVLNGAGVAVEGTRPA
jgi:SAM-dependent methyltransferase